MQVEKAFPFFLGKHSGVSECLGVNKRKKTFGTVLFFRRLPPKVFWPQLLFHCHIRNGDDVVPVGYRHRKKKKKEEAFFKTKDF